MVGAGVLGADRRVSQHESRAALINVQPFFHLSTQSVTSCTHRLTFTGLPSAMVYLGWPAGVIIMTLSWVATLYTLYQMCALHEVKGR